MWYIGILKLQQYYIAPDQVALGWCPSLMQVKSDLSTKFICCLSFPHCLRVSPCHWHCAFLCSSFTPFPCHHCYVPEGDIWCNLESSGKRISTSLPFRLFVKVPIYSFLETSVVWGKDITLEWTSWFWRGLTIYLFWNLGNLINWWRLGFLICKIEDVNFNMTWGVQHALWIECFHQYLTLFLEQLGRLAWISSPSY